MRTFIRHSIDGSIECTINNLYTHHPTISLEDAKESESSRKVQSRNESVRENA